MHLKPHTAVAAILLSGTAAMHVRPTTAAPQPRVLYRDARGVDLDALTRLVRDRIEHVVVLAMENRSFDHMLGTLNTVQPDIDGITGRERCPWNVSDPSQGYQSVVTNSTYWRAPQDPEHILAGVNEQ